MNFLKVIKTLTDECHGRAKKNGWWEKEKPLELGLGLMASELYEGFEGVRKNLMDDKLKHRKMVEVELADFVVRNLDSIGGWNLLPNFSNENERAIMYNRSSEEESLFVYPVGIVESDATDFQKAIQIMQQMTLSGLYSEEELESFKETPLETSIVMLSYLSLKGIDDGVDFAYMVNLILMTDQIAKAYDLDIWGALVEKLEFNDHREDHKPENRAKEGGKRF